MPIKKWHLMISVNNGAVEMPLQHQFYPITQSYTSHPLALFSVVGSASPSTCVGRSVPLPAWEWSGLATSNPDLLFHRRSPPVFSRAIVEGGFQRPSCTDNRAARCSSPFIWTATVAMSVSCVERPMFCLLVEGGRDNSSLVLIFFAGDSVMTWETRMF